MDKILSNLNSKYNIKLSKQQLAAVKHTDGPCIVLAVPGAGKTTTMVIRLYSLIKYHGINPSNILTMTFSRASAKDMEHRFNNLFGDELSIKPRFSTIHSFAYSVISNYERLMGKKYTLIEGDRCPVSKITILKQVYRQIHNEYITDDILDELINTIGFVKNSMIKSQDFSNYDFSISRFNDIYASYEEIKRKNRYLDFDDMLTLAFDVLKMNNKLLDFYRNQYKYILLDEGQDTSIIQYEIVKLIAKPLNNLFIVADDDQSIYGFRGANPSMLLDFNKYYSDAKVYFMEENYRSTKQIVSLANEFIKINQERYKKNLKSNREAGEPVNIISVINENWQAKYLAEELTKVKKLKDNAVLFRNNISSILVAKELYKNNIPFYMKDSKIYLFTHWVTQDVLSFMRLSLNKGDIDAFERIYYRMDAYLPKAAVEYVKENGVAKSVFKTLKGFSLLTEKHKQKIQTIDNMFNLLKYKRPYEAIDFIYNDLKYKEYLKQNGADAGYSIESLDSILHILKAIAKDTENLYQFMDKLNELQDVIQKSSFNKGKNVVTLSTIHSAKGLEYDTVYIINLIDGELPNSESIKMAEWKSNYKPIEEEARLFYVGMTRAKNHLNLVVPESRLGRKINNSRFITRVRTILSPSNKTKSGLPRLPEKGDVIVHNNFGKGTILSLKNGIIEVDFENYGLKKLLLSMCIEDRLIELAE